MNPDDGSPRFLPPSVPEMTAQEAHDAYNGPQLTVAEAKRENAVMWATIAALLIALALVVGVVALHGIRAEMRRANDIECIKLRESGADSLGQIDRDACG